MAKSDRTRPRAAPTDKQVRCIRAIISGATDTEAGKAAGVCRQQVSTWRNHDAVFIQALRIEHNKLTAAIRAAFVDRHKAATDAALDCVIASIKGGDTVAARWLLDKAKGFTSAIEHTHDTLTQPPQLLPADLESIAVEIAEREATAYMDSEGWNDIEQITAAPVMIAELAADILEALNDAE